MGIRLCCVRFWYEVLVLQFGTDRRRKKSTLETASPNGLKLRNKDDESAIAPLLPNTSLALLRLCGKYLQLLLLLRPVAFDVLVCISHLFEFYIYSLCKFFAPDLVSMVRWCKGRGLWTRGSMKLERVMEGFSWQRLILHFFHPIFLKWLCFPLKSRDGPGDQFEVIV